jgi:hypothetical protein
MNNNNLNDSMDVNCSTATVTSTPTPTDAVPSIENRVSHLETVMIDVRLDTMGM